MQSQCPFLLVVNIITIIIIIIIIIITIVFIIIIIQTRVYSTSDS